MVLYRAQVAIQDRSLLPRDEYVNTIYLSSAAILSDADMQSKLALIANMYTGPLNTYFSDQVKAGAANAVSKVTLYGAGASPPHPPLSVFNFSMGAPGAVISLPAEVACCLSFRHLPLPTGVKPASARGRIYIGPLNTNVLSAAALNSGQSRPTQSFTDAVADAGQSLATALEGGATPVYWVIASRKLGQYFPVTEFRVDDAWDTQRSRGDRPSRISSVAHASGGGGGSGSF